MFSQHGYEFCGIDQKGFGLSEGTKGRFDGMDSSIDQVQKFNELYAQTFDPQGETPKFLMGHSLGGMISSLIGCQQDKSDLKYDGLCLLAPFYNFKDKSLIEKMRPLLQMMGNVSPDKMFPASGNSSAKMHMKEWNEDPLNMGSMITPHNILQIEKALKTLDSDMVFQK